MSRLGPLFDTLRAENRRALIPYVVAGDPTEALTAPLGDRMDEASRPYSFLCGWRPD